MSKLSTIKKNLEILPEEWRGKSLDEIENDLLKRPQLEDSDYSLKEYYSGGMYCRQITIPAGALITGRVYKFDHVEIMLSGDITIISDDGSETFYTGNNVIEAKAGKRQAGFSHSETTWLTINSVPEEILPENRLDYTSVLTYEEFNQFHIDVNQFDYQYFLSEVGLTQEQMDEIVKADDIVSMDEKYIHIHTSKSQIDGDGLFSKVDILAGDIICPVRIKEKRTIAGRYSNHAMNANAEPFEKDGVFYIVAKVNIKAGEEITTNYRDVLSFRDSRGDLL